MIVQYRRISDELVLSHRIHGVVEDLPALFSRLMQVAGDAAIGVPLVIQHFPLTDDDGRTMDVCVPLSHPIDCKEFQIISLDGGVAAIARHEGPYATIMNTYRQLIPEVYKHGHPIQENGREAFYHLDLEQPEKTVIEIQAMIIDWDSRLDHHLERVMGAKTKNRVLSGFDELTLETEQPERAIIIKEALQKLDGVATEEQKYEAISLCGHEFPEELIDQMQKLYQETNDFNQIIHAMTNGHFFFPKLRRVGNVIYDRKAPARKQSFDEAQTREERLRAACFCPLIKDMWDEMPASFCYCGAGWSRRLFEGILGIPLKIEVVKSLTNGDDYCEFAIHLPEGIK